MILKKKIIKEKNRASWCYGTPGIARVLYLASKAVGNKTCEDFAYKCLNGLTIMQVDEFMLDSPTICHGFSGVLMIADSMYKETKQENFKKLSDLICKKILSTEDQSYDFLYYNYDYSFKGKTFASKQNFEDLSLLEGATGVILALLSYTSKEDLIWKKILLV